MRAPGGDSVSRSTGHGGASGIAWFQGTVEEAFSTVCTETKTAFHY
jgi:hypothetical protein